MAKGEGGGPFPREERLAGAKDIRMTLSSKDRVGTRGAKLFFRLSGLATKRIAFVTARKFGHAVDRNRAKRQGRAAYRANRRRIPDGWDIVFLMYPSEEGAFDRGEQFYFLIEKAVQKMRSLRI